MDTYTWKETIHGDEIESTVERAAEPHLGFIYTYRNLSAGGERRPWPGGSRESLTEELLRLAEEVERVRGIASFHASARNGNETLIRELREEVERLTRELKEHTHCAADGEVLMLYNSADTAEFRKVGADDEQHACPE